MFRLPRTAGFGLSEILVVFTISAALLTVSVPMGLNYYHNSQTKTGAQQIRTLLNHARQIAMDERTFVCVHVSSPSQLCFYVNTTCTGTPWRGSITDSDGNITLPAGFAVAASGEPVFDYLGRALPAVTYTVTNGATASTVTVSVATSGRVTIP